MNNRNLKLRNIIWYAALFTSHINSNILENFSAALDRYSTASSMVNYLIVVAKRFAFTHQRYDGNYNSKRQK